MSVIAAEKTRVQGGKSSLQSLPGAVEQLMPAGLLSTVHVVLCEMSRSMTGAAANDAQSPSHSTKR